MCLMKEEWDRARLCFRNFNASVLTINLSVLQLNMNLPIAAEINIASKWVPVSICIRAIF